MVALTKLFAKDLQLGISTMEANMCNTSVQRSKRMKLKALKNRLRFGLFKKKRSTMIGNKSVHLTMTVKKIITTDHISMKMMTVV